MILKKLLILVFLFSSCLFLFGCTTIHTVIFDLDGGIRIGGGELVQKIKEGEDAVFPLVEKENYTVDYWNSEITSITEDKVIRAIWKENRLTSEQIYAAASISTVELSTYDSKMEKIATGTGFFISNDGKIATNYHVIEDAYYIFVTLQSGLTKNIHTVVGYDEELDIAILQMNYHNSPYLSISTREIVTGATVYTLGSPFGFTLTFSEGIISNAYRTIDFVNYIQITAPISPGNSGGPLLNVYGEVIGINTLQISIGQNLNFSINISHLIGIDTSNPITVQQFYEETVYFTVKPLEYIIPEKEVNDSMGLAHKVYVNGTTVQGDVKNKSDVDYYRFEVIESAKLFILIIPEYDIDATYLTLSIHTTEGVFIKNGVKEVIELRSFVVLEHTFLESQIIYIRIGLTTSYPYTEKAPYSLFIFAKYT